MEQSGTKTSMMLIVAVFLIVFFLRERTPESTPLYYIGQRVLLNDGSTETVINRKYERPYLGLGRGHWMYYFPNKEPTWWREDWILG